jgi:hypothetical protein
MKRTREASAVSGLKSSTTRFEQPDVLSRNAKARGEFALGEFSGAAEATKMDRSRRHGHQSLSWTLRVGLSLLPLIVACGY